MYILSFGEERGEAIEKGLRKQHRFFDIYDCCFLDESMRIIKSTKGTPTNTTKGTNVIVIISVLIYSREDSNSLNKYRNNVRAG